jgi:GNAT superfamily N-acetyltransferase
MQFVIRPATAEDEGAFVDMFLEFNQFEAPMTRDRRTDYAAAVETLASARGRVSKDHGHILAAEQDGRVVGMLFMVFLMRDVYVQEDLRRYAYITDLFVREEARGAGIATALIAEAERIAAASGVKRISIGVLAWNTPADRLYARLGFEPYYTERAKPVRHSGRSIDPK